MGLVANCYFLFYFLFILFCFFRFRFFFYFISFFFSPRWFLVRLVAIAGVVYAGALVCQPISGGSFNPAMSICLSIVDGFANFHYALLQAMVQLCGALAASAFFYLVAPEEMDAVSWPWPPAVCDDLASVLK